MSFVSQIWVSYFRNKVCYYYIFLSPVQVILGEEAAYCKGNSSPGALISRIPHDPSLETVVMVGGWLPVFLEVWSEV